jgi:hypothetical protein
MLSDRDAMVGDGSDAGGGEPLQLEAGLTGSGGLLAPKTLKAVARFACWPALAVTGVRMPMSRTRSPCCARAASGQTGCRLHISASLNAVKCDACTPKSACFRPV